MKKQNITTKKEVNIDSIDAILIKKTNMKRLYIKVKPPNGEVVISAPSNMSDREIKSFFISKIDFIKNSILDVKKTHEKSVKHYVDGEIHYLWGEAYKLKLLFGENNVKLEDGFIKIYSKNHSLDVIKKLLIEFYREELNSVLIDYLNEATRLTGIFCDEIRIKNMKTNWGSCNILKKRIWVSLNLAKYPKICLLYILIHELTHLKEKYHNQIFYKLLDSAFDKRRECDLILKEIL